MKKLQTGVLFCVMSVGLTALAHHNVQIITDRPDTAESSQTVREDHFQIETSFGIIHNTEDGITTDTYNFPTLFRFGPSDNWELRLASDMIQTRTETGADGETGFSDIEIGTKVHIVDLKDWFPSMALLFHLSLPTGSDIFSSNAFEPTFLWMNDWDLPCHFTLGTNIGFDLPVQDDEGDKYTRFLYVASVGHPMPFYPDRWKFFVEFSGALPTISGKTQTHYYNTGTIFLVTDNFQMDLYFNIGLNRLTNDFGTGIGFSVRM